MTNTQHPQGSRGFTLLEVLITLGILAMLMMAVSQMLRGGFDLRLDLSAEGRVTQKLNSLMQRLADDISVAYLISRKDLVRPGGGDRTVFKIGKDGNDSIFTFTYMGHQSLEKNAKESELSYVVYQLKASEKFPQRRDLYRGELPRIPEDAAKRRELPPMALFASDIASIQIDPWLGDDWGKDGWDSTHGDQENKLPQMVRIIIRGWSSEAKPDGPGSGEAEATTQYSTVVYLPFGVEFPSIKTRMNSFRL